MERRFAIFLWKLFHMGAIHHTLIENTRTCLLNVPCAATVWKVTNDAFSSKNHACHLWIRTAWGRKWFGVTPCKTKLVKLLRSPFSPLFQTGNSKIYTLIKNGIHPALHNYILMDAHSEHQEESQRASENRWSQKLWVCQSQPLSVWWAVDGGSWLWVCTCHSLFVCVFKREWMYAYQAHLCVQTLCAQVHWFPFSFFFLVCV